VVDGTHYYSLHKPTSTDWWQNTSDRTLPAPHTAAKLAYPSSRRAPKPLSGEVHRLQLHSSRPGNVREPKTEVEAALVLSAGDEIPASDVCVDRPGASSNGVASGIFEEAEQQRVETFERGFIIRALRQHRGDITHAATEIGLRRRQVQ